MNPLNLFRSPAPKALRSLRDVMKQQDDEAAALHATEVFNQVGQLEVATALATELRGVLPEGFKIRPHSAIHGAPCGAITDLVIEIPDPWQDAVAENVKVLQRGTLVIRVYSPRTPSNYQRMLEEVAYVARRLRDICKQDA
jgi:hypothetical protein